LSIDKILSRDELKHRVEAWRTHGEKITLTNGGFDLLHVGHIRYLHAAKRLGGKLVVAINSDESVRALKGDGRPLVPENERAEIVSALSDVDAVVIFPELDVRALVREIRPDVHAKGTDYTADNVPERDTVIECGGRVEIVGARSSTAREPHRTYDSFSRFLTGRAIGGDGRCYPHSCSRLFDPRCISRDAYRVGH
jgi:D-glycero-beta-D-manno-heptose 1-phosphate adenylyltransferase